MTKLLAALAERQGGVVTVAQARLVLGRAAVDRSVRSGELVVVARGVLTRAETWELAATGDSRKLALQGAARLVRTRRPAVLSHETAAQLWGLPLLRRPTGPPSLTLVGAAPRSSGHVHARHVAPVPVEHRTRWNGVPLTTPARTVADVCRTPDTYAALVVADAALAEGLDRAQVEEALRLARRWPFAAAGRQHLSLASRWSESPLESLSLHWCRLQGLPVPQQQLTVRTLDGVFVARTDLAWPDLGVVGEMDGRGKYGDSAVLWAEKGREDWMRDLGLEVGRGTWADGSDDGAAFAARMRRAFARAAARPLPLACRILDERDHTVSGRFAASSVPAVAAGSH